MSMNNISTLSFKQKYIIKILSMISILKDNKAEFHWFNDNTTSQLFRCVNAIINDRLISFVLVYAIRKYKNNNIICIDTCVI